MVLHETYLDRYYGPPTHVKDRVKDRTCGIASLPYCMLLQPLSPIIRILLDGGTIIQRIPNPAF